MPQHVGHAMLSDINISQGSVATPLRCGEICNIFYCKFPAECNSEGILKIRQYLSKLWTRVLCLVFLTHSVVLRQDLISSG